MRCSNLMMCIFVLFIMTGASAYLSNIHISTKSKISFFGSTLDDDEILKMTKKGILFYFKSQIQLYQQLIESKDFSSAQLVESKERLVESTERLVESTERLVESKASDAALNHFKLQEANKKYLKLKGNLNVRGLIEEFEQSELFKQCRKKLTVKVTVTDEASKRTFVESRAPNRKMLWDEALRDGELSKLLACIEESNPERRDTVGERIRDLYSSLSKEVHKYADDDYISILSNRLFDHEVGDIVLLRSLIRVIFCCDIYFWGIYQVKLAVCLCEHYNAPYQVEKEGAFEDPDKLKEIDEEEQ